MNQSIISHTRLLIILSGTVAFGAFAIDMYLPALPTMATELGATSTQLQLTLSIFFTGFCVGMLIYGPLSDHFGRRKLLLSGILLFAVTSAACMFAVNTHQLLILRGFQALGCGACVVMARAASRDIFPPAQLHSMMSKMSLVTMMAPLLAPLIGAVSLMLAGWRSIFGVLTSIALVAFYFVYRYIPETLTPDTDRRLHLGNVLRTYGQLLASKKNITLMLCMACAMSGMFAFIGGAPFVYTQVLGYSELEFALLFGSNIVGMSLITSLNLYLLKRFQASSLMTYQSGALLLAGVGLVTMRATGHIDYIVPLVILYVSHVNALCANGMASLLHLHHTNRAGSVSALAVSIQFGLAAVSTSLVATFSHSPASAMTGVMLLFGVMAFVCAVSQRKMS
ncbi:Bcr/CflA family drug resistance efflux transporter [Formosimonas limnophila]|uniref:Bcr/CflA family efflux transporter n=1 Tax=Formosimonas limnophila TaxID=1384487 RepID=A0A8J3CFC8_9BURK|nr:multidrug effflux MFS transporter [Formosimonas limnophila]GHA65163.1 Bcr/CflA family drug resistance efflux transporter [Formosimonas limnophila]